MTIPDINGYHIRIFNGESDALVYLHAAPEDGAEIWEMLSPPKPSLVIISGYDWNRDFSPWPAKKVFAKGDDFSGGGRAYLSILAGDIIPAVENALPQPPARRCIAGYSLAGLFALWSAFETDLFDSAAALSPSLWFDDFSDYLNARCPSPRLKRVCLSLGDSEKKTRNPRMACIEQAALSAVARLEALNIETCFHFNPGGHFNEVSLRIARGIGHL